MANHFICLLAIYKKFKQFVCLNLKIARDEECPLIAIAVSLNNRVCFAVNQHRHTTIILHVTCYVQRVVGYLANSQGRYYLDGNQDKRLAPQCK